MNWHKIWRRQCKPDDKHWVILAAISTVIYPVKSGIHTVLLAKRENLCENMLAHRANQMVASAG